MRFAAYSSCAVALLQGDNGEDTPPCRPGVWNKADCGSQASRANIRSGPDLMLISPIVIMVAHDGVKGEVGERRLVKHLGSTIKVEFTGLTQTLGHL